MRRSSEARPAGGRLGPGEEFRRIEGFLEGISPVPGVRVGPGDDAAVLVDGTVLSTDLTIEGVHFRREWLSLREAGYRATVAALSDLAAMAAEPVGILVSLAVPSDEDGELMAGAREAAAASGAALLGGDLTRSPDPIVIDVVVVGRSERPLLRSGARPGDELWVTGRLGAAALAVEEWRAGREPEPALREAFARPVPRLAEARALVDRLGARAGLDLSDGLVGDAGHLAAASGVSVVLDAFRVPLVAVGGEPPARTGVEVALHGGEDYELLVALPTPLPEEEVERFQKRFQLSLTRVGSVHSGEGVRIRDRDGEDPRPAARRGWDHFERDDGGDGS